MRTPARLALAQLPTPLVPAERLAREFGGAAVWLKRDDLTGLELSGNKIRKLEYIAADALARGADTLVTEGTPQSNHCRATAVVSAKFGLRCRLLLRPEPPAGPPQGNHLVDVLCGAEWRAWPRDEFRAQHDAIVRAELDQLRAAGRRPRWTPMGASEALGCWGYLQAAVELAGQVQAAGLGRVDVVVAISSGATVAGLVLGKLLHRLDGLQLWAVPVSDDVPHHRAEVARLCQETIEQFALPVAFTPEAVQFLAGYVGAGYAVPHPAANNALRMLARTEAVLLDPVYTAKAFWALLEGVRRRQFGLERPVVFLHTGGLFSDFAWPELLA